MPYFRISSLHCLCVAKQAMAHILISTPVWNCFPLMSHTPWLGVATVRFWGNKSNRHSSDYKKNQPVLFAVSGQQRKVYHSKSDPCRVKVYRKSFLKMESRGKAKASPVLRTAASGLGAHVLSHGPSHPLLWTGTLGQMDLHHNLHFSPKRDLHVTEISDYNPYNKPQANRNAAEVFLQQFHWKRLRHDCSILSTHPQWKQFPPWDLIDEEVSVPFITQVLIFSLLIQKYFFQHFLTVN